MHPFVRVLAYSTLALAVLTACAQVVPASPNPAASSDSTSTPAAPAAEPTAAADDDDDVAAAKAAPRNSRLDAQLLYEILVAEISFRTVDPQGAAAFMLDIARHEGDAGLYQRATQMAVQAHAGPLALEAVHAWVKAYPDSVDASRYELRVLLALGRIAQSAGPVKALLSEMPEADKTSFIIALPAIYQNVSDKNASTSAVEDALADATETPALAAAAWTTIGRMRLRADDTTGALSAAALGQSADAQSEWPALLALQLFASGDAPDAEPLLQNYLKKADATPDIRVDYARILVSQERLKEAQQQLTLLTQRTPDYARAWLEQGMLYADEDQDERARQTLTHYLKLAQAQKTEEGDREAQGVNQAHLVLAKLAEARGDFAAAERHLAQVNAPGQALAVAIQRADLLAQQGQLAEARQTIAAVPERVPGDARLKLLAEAQLLRDNGEAAEAYQMLTDALKTAPDDDRLLYDAAMTAEKLDRMADMERLLRRVIALKPDAAYAYNALGYSLADRGLRLPEAKALIEKAVHLAPDDLYIQDSLGWVEYRLGHLAQARTLLQGAYDKQRDPEIAAHLGEVLWQLGEHKQAEAVWQQGLKSDATNPVLLETMQRLQGQP